MRRSLEHHSQIAAGKVDYDVAVVGEEGSGLEAAAGFRLTGYEIFEPR